jgi:hypothetical protein
LATIVATGGERHAGRSAADGEISKEEAVLRRLVLLFWAMAATLLMVGGVARAEALIGTEAPTGWLAPSMMTG